jgi:predicted RNA-binding Zn ribbon-like protein
MLLVMGMPSWVPGAESKPAPMPLLLVQAFLNTWDGDRGSDLLLDPDAARAWLAESGLWDPGRRPGPAELDLARRVREDIRALLAAHSGGSPPAPGDLPAIRAVTEAARPALRIGPGGQVSLTSGPERGLEARLADLLIVIRDAQRDGTWPRLKACGNPDCRWAFYDRSHRQAGAWCDMATCGNRIKNRRLRQRQAGRP